MLPSENTRRQFIAGLGASLGAIAFQSLLRGEELATEQADKRSRQGPMAVKPQMVPGKAKACIMLTMSGGPSHLDTFDPKPKLAEMHLKEFNRKSKFASAMSSGKRYYVQSPFKFKKAGNAGIDICEHFAELANFADDLCVYRGCQAESVNHPTANYHMNTGSRFGGDPAIGSWVTYGLGSVNQNLPGFMVLPEVAYPQGGAANWSNGFLPAHFQGTTLRSGGSPILDLTPPPEVTREQQRKNLDLLAKLNAEHAESHPQHSQLAARMENYELAFRMQSEVPDLLSIADEDEATIEMYGLNEAHTREFGRRCLLARRLVEKGVRFVQLYSAGWDSHDYLERSHRNRIQAVDKPMAALLKDLKQRGLLDETLIVWGGEFGRSPDNGQRGGGQRLGRDHNAKAMSLLLAGGGSNAGHVVGATDEIGDEAVEVARPIRDLHVTLLRLLGLDDNKLTYFHGGRYKQLSQVGGEVIDELIG